MDLKVGAKAEMVKKGSEAIAWYQTKHHQPGNFADSLWALLWAADFVVSSSQESPEERT